MKDHFLAFIVSGLAYGLFGWWGLTLAIPPGFASAVWPAAGVALACVLLFKSKYSILGVGLGSFLVNLSVSSDNGAHISLVTMIPAFSIAMGAVLQSVVGRGLFLRFIGKASVLAMSKHLAFFALVIAVLVCMVSASIGSTTLYFKGFISIENLPFTWLTWWVGDSIGVLLFTPLIMALFSSSKSHTNIRKAQIVLPVLFIFMGVWMFFLISLENNRTEQVKKFRSISIGYAKEIDKRIHLAEQKLEAYTALFKSNTRVTRQQFDQFSSVILDRDSVFQGIGWTQIIPHENRDDVENSIKKEGFPNFEFTEFSEHGNIVRSKYYEEYYPVLYIYPMERNKKAFGLNLAANQERKSALIKSRSSKKDVATAPITLAQETESLKATIMYVPIFGIDLKFLGYVSGVMRINGILGDVLSQSLEKHIVININDVTDVNTPLPLLEDTRPPLKTIPPLEYSMEFGGRVYQLELSASSDYLAYKKDWTSWLILTGGFFLSALLLVFLLYIINSMALIDLQVQLKTKELRKAVKKAEAANEAKSSFLANMSHEFRTPLNAIIGFMNLAKKESNSIKRQQFLADGVLASDTLLGLINQSLDYAKIESGKLELNFVSVSLLEKLKKVKAIFIQQAQVKNLAFEINVIDSIPNNVMADTLRLEQIILNLVNNAVKFTEVGYVKLEVSAQTVGDNVRLQIIIEDSGIGISYENHQTVFDAFQQEDSSTSRNYGGTGLGLSISRELAELMKGSIELDPEYTHGCRFIVTLNLGVDKNTGCFTQVDLDNNTAPLEASAEIELDDDCLGHCTILLVEDVLMNQIVAQEILSGYGAEVLLAENGQVALDMLAEANHVDVVLMDIQMPVMDGYAATKAIRSQPKYDALPILAMTANAMDSDVEMSLEVGMQGHIAKPINERILLSKILSLLSARKSV